jgi:hypothetical protein
MSYVQISAGYRIRVMKCVIFCSFIVYFDIFCIYIFEYYNIRRYNMNRIEILGMIVPVLVLLVIYL